MSYRIDHTDRKILGLLQSNARTPLKYLAQKVFLSSPAVSSRICKLEKKGVITGYHASINPNLLGFQIQAFVTLMCESNLKEDFFDFAKNCNHILECHCITGQNSIMMKVVFTDPKELDAFVNVISKFGKTDSQIILSTPIEHRGLPNTTDSFLSDLAV